MMIRFAVLVVILMALAFRNCDFTDLHFLIGVIYGDSPFSVDMMLTCS